MLALADKNDEQQAIKKAAGQGCLFGCANLAIS